MAVSQEEIRLDLNGADSFKIPDEDIGQKKDRPALWRRACHEETGLILNNVS